MKTMEQKQSNNFSAILFISDTPDINGNVYTKEALINAANNFNEKNIGELDHVCQEDLSNYFLCSAKVIDTFPEFEHSNPFKSGYDFDKDKNYFVAKFDFDKVSEYYINNIEPFEAFDFDFNNNFWCEECVGGTMDISKITISGIKRNGLFVEIENKTGLTNTANRAMSIQSIAKDYNITPIELINKIAPIKKTKKIVEVIKCCNNCSNYGHQGPSWDQPYPEFWCGKKHWEGIGSQEELDSLLDEINCEDFEKIK